MRCESLKPDSTRCERPPVHLDRDPRGRDFPCCGHPECCDVIGVGWVAVPLPGTPDPRDARIEALAALLRADRKAMLDCATTLQRDVLVTGSEKANKAADRAREQVAQIDAALGGNQ